MAPPACRPVDHPSVVWRLFGVTAAPDRRGEPGAVHPAAVPRQTSCLRYPALSIRRLCSA